MNDFTEKIQNLYNDFAQRIDLFAWKTLFEEAFEIAPLDEVSEKTLEFLMENYLLPVAVWHYFDQIFDWDENQEELTDIYPPQFISFIIKMLKNTEDNRRYHLFDTTLDRDFDRFLELHSELIYRLNVEQLEEAQQLLDELEMLDIEHPDYLLEKARLEAILGNPDEGLSLIDFIVEEYPEDYENYSHAIFIRSLILASFDDEGLLDEAINLLENLIFDDKDYYFEKLALANFYEKQGDLQKAYLFILDEILSANPSDGYLVAKMFDLATKLRDVYQEKFDQEIIDDNELFELAKYYLINGQIDEAQQIFTDHPQLESLEKYNQRMADISFAKKDYDSTIIFAKKSLENEPNLLTARTLAESYMHLRQFDEAVEVIDDAVKNIEAKGYDEVGRALSLEAKARIYYRLKDHETALLTINEALELNHKIATLFCTKAKILTELTDYNEAFENAEIARQMMPYTVDAYAIQAKLYYTFNYFEEVIEVINSANAEIRHREILDYYHALTLRELALTEDDEVQLKTALNMLLKLEENETMTTLDSASPEDLLYPQLLAQIAYTYWYLDQMTPALTFIERAIQLAEVEEESDMVATWYEFKATVYERIDEQEQAINILNLAIQKHPHHAPLLTKRGQLLANTEQFEQAIIDLDASLQIDDTDENTYSTLIYCYYTNENHEQAISYAQQWTNQTNDINAYGTLAYCYSLANQKENQLKTLKEALTQHTDDFNLLTELGNLYEETRQFSQGIDIWKQILATNPENIMARTSLAYCQNAIGENIEALENINEGLNMLPNEPDFHIWKAIILQDFNQNHEAIEVFETAIELLEENESYWRPDDLYSRIGYVYAQNLNDGEKALAAFEKAVELNPEDDNHFDMLGYLYEDYLKNTDKAIEAYLQAIKLNPTAHPYLNVGNIYNEQKDAEKATFYYEKALELSDPKPTDDHEAYAIHGRILIGLKRYEEAIIFIEKAKEIAKTDGRNSKGECMCVYSSYAQYYEALNQYDKALDAVDYSLTLGDSVYGNVLKKKILAKTKK